MNTVITHDTDVPERPATEKRVGSVLSALCLVILVAACGGGKGSLTEYVESINGAVVQAEQRAAEFRAEGVLAEDSSPRQVANGLARLLEEVRVPLQEAADSIDPPRQVADLHTLLWHWHAELIRVETAVAARVAVTPDTGTGWAAFSSSPEVAAYRTTLADGKQVCADLQARLDGTEQRSALQDIPWLPSELGEVVNAALGCAGFPEDPQSVYRFPTA